MNIKLHTPKSLKTGSGMGTLKQFLLSLIATTVSIVLTFGTAAIIDNNKKQKEKREIVMMVMYDMYNSLQSVEKADSMLCKLMELQLQMAKNTAKFQQMKFQQVGLIPQVQFTETTERIFSSTIETINTVGNVLFTENVAEFYQTRGHYKTMVCDSLSNKVSHEYPLASLKGSLDVFYCDYALLSKSYVASMRHLYVLCKQMMNVSDDDLKAYQKERLRIEENVEENQDDLNKTMEDIMQLQKDIDEAKGKLKTENDI